MPEAVTEKNWDDENNNTPTPALFKTSGKGDICFLPRHYSDYSRIIDKFQVREDDVWVISYIKAGETAGTNLTLQLVS